MSKLFSFLFKTLLILFVPFIMLIRVAVHLHTSNNLLPWMCIIFSIIMTSIVIFIYLSLIHAMVNRQHYINVYSIKRRIFISLLIVLIYAGHGLFYFSNNNLKNKSARTEMSQIHPVLRLATSTLIHIDKDLLITDGQRLPEDYKKMGLKSKSQSLHYKQYTGYTHAIDLRTKNRAEWKNQLVRGYFWLMGFRTLRHKGTTDHLHISLMSHQSPDAY